MLKMRVWLQFFHGGEKQKTRTLDGRGVVTTEHGGAPRRSVRPSLLSANIEFSRSEPRAVVGSPRPWRRPDDSKNSIAQLSSLYDYESLLHDIQ